MKRILLIVSAIIFVIADALAARPVKEYFTIGNPIEFEGANYYLSSSSHPKSNKYVQEYLPEGESSKLYNRMFSVTILLGDSDAYEAMVAKVFELRKRFHIDPNVAMIYGKHKSYGFIDVMLSDARVDNDTDKIEMGQRDMYVYREITIDGEKALMIVYYSMRAYGEESYDFLPIIIKERPELYEVMHKLKLKPKFPKK